MAETVRGSLRSPKNWFRKDRRTHERVPKTHIRKVRTGSDSSSVVDTVRATCFTGEFSSGSCSPLPMYVELLGSISMACDEFPLMELCSTTMASLLRRCMLLVLSGPSYSSSRVVNPVKKRPKNTQRL